MQRMFFGFLLLIMSVVLAGCAGMNSTEQRMLSGGAMGSAAGAGIGALSGGNPATGAAIGGAAGVAGGAVVDQMDRRRY